MGAGVSCWSLAREVSRLGQLGVVSGTALDSILARRLNIGDPGGHVREAMAAFPVPRVAQEVLAKYYRPEGEIDAEGAQGNRFKLLPLPRAILTPERQWLLILANFVEVYLARQGALEGGGKVGINYLHKIQLPNLASMYGAMLAQVDAVLMGAGIPVDIPPALDKLSRHEPASLDVEMLDDTPTKPTIDFDPMALWRAEGLEPPTLTKPKFLAIISSVVLAKALLKKVPGGIDGFIVEAPTAGGHNAPPRGPMQLSVRGEPIYGPRDDVDFSQLVALGKPFWLAGGYGTRDKFEAALATGARGVQLGTIFAFCNESGLDPELRTKFLESLIAGEAWVFTDPLASPTNFPFKVAMMKETLSDEGPYQARPRLCDLGYLRRAYTKPDGTVGYRCPSEPDDEYLAKGGDAEQLVGRKCLCNALMANIGLGQRRKDGYVELPMLTAGDDLHCIKPFIKPGHVEYHVSDVLGSLGLLPAPAVMTASSFAPTAATTADAT